MRKLINISQINLLPDNPKEHDIDALILSFETFGFLGSVIINESNKLDLSGNGRVEALRRMKAEGKPAPAGVIVDTDDGGEWVIEADFYEFDEKRQKAVANALNKLQDRGGVNEALLTKYLAEYADDETLIIASGYDLDEVTALLLKYSEPPEFGDGEGLSDEPESAPAPQAPLPANASHVRMVQLFYNDKTQPEFLTFCDALIESGTVKREDGEAVENISELVLEVMRGAYNSLG